MTVSNMALSHNSHNADSCPICLDSLAPQTASSCLDTLRAKVQGLFSKTPINSPLYVVHEPLNANAEETAYHVFHPACIDSWLKAHSTCPSCRAKVSPPLIPPPLTPELSRLTQQILQMDQISKATYARSYATSSVAGLTALHILGICTLPLAGAAATASLGIAYFKTKSAPEKQHQECKAAFLSLVQERPQDALSVIAHLQEQVPDLTASILISFLSNDKKAWNKLVFVAAKQSDASFLHFLQNRFRHPGTSTLPSLATLVSQQELYSQYYYLHEVNPKEANRALYHLTSEKIFDRNKTLSDTQELPVEMAFKNNSHYAIDLLKQEGLIKTPELLGRLVHFAVKHKNSKALETLLSLNAPLDTRSSYHICLHPSIKLHRDYSLTPLDLAVYHQDVTAVRLLLQAGAPISSRTKEHPSTFDILATRTKDVNQLLLLLESASQ